MRLMRVFRFVLALRSLISSIAETFLGAVRRFLGGKVVACTLNVCGAEYYSIIHGHSSRVGFLENNWIIH